MQVYPLHSRQIDQARAFFQSIVQPDLCIHVLLPPPYDPNLFTRLRNPRKYPVARNRTKKYVSCYWFLLCLLYFISRTLVFSTVTDMSECDRQGLQIVSLICRRLSCTYRVFASIIAALVACRIFIVSSILLYLHFIHIYIHDQQSTS